MDHLSGASDTPFYGPVACDGCKRRKVKCDTAAPCSNCTTSGILCERRTLPRKRGRPSKQSTRRSRPRQVSGQDPGSAGSPAAGIEPPRLLEPESGPFPEIPMPEQWITTKGIPRTPATTSSRTTGSAPVSAAETPGFPGNVRPIPRNTSVLDASEVFRKLYVTVEEQLYALRGSNSVAVSSCVRTCIDLFMQYQFPNTPIAHEPTLRSTVALFEEGPESRVFGSVDGPSVESQRALTLVTALCALVFSALPDNLLPGPRELVWPFYHASRAMLKLFEEVDLESPHSSSYYIRTWQSAALQNTTGRDWASWHIHGEGTMLAMRARIYDEAAIAHLPSHEAALLRVNFWLMYLADKTAAAFEARPYVIHDDCLAGGLTLRDDPTEEVLLLDPSRACNQNNLEQRLLASFHLKRRLWAAAADMVTQIRDLTSRRRQQLEAEQQEDGIPTPALSPSHVAKLSTAYLRFLALADHLPPWLQSPHRAVEGLDAAVSEYQVVSFWAQRSNIMSVYQCMRMLILQKCVDAGVPEIVGLSADPVAVAMQTLQIARDFLLELQLAPFACFKAQGESAVERVRRVGGILLAMVNTPPTPAVEARARHLLEQLLDILASLDSKATDGLESPGFPHLADFCI